MKVVVTSDSPSIEGNVEQRFGRCRYFIVAEIEGKKIKGWEAVENIGAAQAHGAGTQAAQQVGKIGAEAVISGNLGPNADNILKQLSINVYRAEGSIKDAIGKFSEGDLEALIEIVPVHQILSSDMPKRSGKILFPLLDNNGEESIISEHFGHAPYFGLYDEPTKKLEIVKNGLDHADMQNSPADQIIEAYKPAVVFAKGIGSRALDIFRKRGVVLKTGPFGTLKDAISNLHEMEDLTADCGE